MEAKKHKKCSRCKEYFTYDESNTKWDYSGFTNTKLAQCPLCGCWQAVKYEIAPNVNFDERYYS